MSGVSSWVPQVDLSWVTSKFSIDIDCEDYLTEPLVQSTCETVAEIIAVAGLVSFVAGAIFSSMTLGVAGFVALALGSTNYLYVANYGKLSSKLTTEKTAAASAADTIKASDEIKARVKSLEDQIIALQGSAKLLVEEKEALVQQNSSLDATVHELEGQLSIGKELVTQFKGVAHEAKEASEETTAAADTFAGAERSLEGATAQLEADESKGAAVQRSLDETVSSAIEAGTLLRANSVMMGALITIQQQLRELGLEDHARVIEKLPALTQIS